MSQPPAGPTVTESVAVDGAKAGTAAVRFPTVEPAEVVALRTHLVRVVAVGAVLAALLAVAVALVVSRRLTRPIGALTRVARRREAGDRW